MPEPDAKLPLEPWPGYAATAPDERCRRLQLKYEEARLHGDQAYAVALTAAVANYEAQLARDPGGLHDAQALARAIDLHDDAGSWLPF
jgi:hypothetical protein